MKTIFVFALMGANSRQLGTLLLFFLGLAMAVGLYDAWSRQRGVLGWLVSIVVSVIGAFFGLFAITAVLDSHLLLQFEGSVISMATTVGGLLAGSWAAIWLVNRFR